MYLLALADISDSFFNSHDERDVAGFNMAPRNHERILWRKVDLEGNPVARQIVRFQNMSWNAHTAPGT